MATDYMTGYKHGMKDMHTHTLILLNEAQEQAKAFGITTWPIERARKRIVDRYNQLTKETG